jgi:hypothetical protein
VLDKGNYSMFAPPRPILPGTDLPEMSPTKPTASPATPASDAPAARYAFDPFLSRCYLPLWRKRVIATAFTNGYFHRHLLVEISIQYVKNLEVTSKIGLLILTRKNIYLEILIV